MKNKICIMCFILFALNNICFAKVEKNYVEEKNRFTIEYSKEEYFGPEDRLLMSLFVHNIYYFEDKFFDQDSQKYKHYSALISIMNSHRPDLLENRVQIEQVGTYKQYSLEIPYDFKFKNSKGACSGHIFVKKHPVFADMIKEGKALDLKFTFKNSPSLDGAKNIVMHLTEADVKELQEVLSYDLYNDAEQMNLLSKILTK